MEALRASESKDAATTEARAALRGLAKEARRSTPRAAACTKPAHER